MSEQNKPIRAQQLTDAMIKKVEQKLNLLDKWVGKGGAPKDKETGEYVFFPTNATELADWESEGFEVEWYRRSSWEKKIDLKTYRAKDKRALKKKQDRVMSALVKIQESIGSKGESLAKLTTQLKSEKGRAKSLASELSALHEELGNANDEIARLRARNEGLREDNQKLVRKLQQSQGSLHLVETDA